MSDLKDISGQQFGRLTVIERRGSTKHSDATWRCRCECGNEAVVIGRCLISGRTRSCGCLRREMAANLSKPTHGMTSTKLFRVWGNMRERCSRPRHKSFDSYGGRGITVCAEWQNDFKAFYDWAMANGYRDGLTIDRIDTNGNYEPSNCRWATQKEQQNNRRSNRRITYNGETMTTQQWSERLDIHVDTIRWRLSHGWPLERVFSKGEEVHHEKDGQDHEADAPRKL